MNPRTCIVTKEQGDAAGMIRFVAGPDGAVVPDIKRRLEGRGVWVTANREAVEKAIERNLFARGLKQQVNVPPDLAERIDGLLEKQALAALSMARKAGLVVTGFAKCDAAVRSGKVALLLHALEASPDGVRKFNQAIHMVRELGAEPPAVNQSLNGEQMDLALGGHNVVHAAAMHGGAATALAGAVAALTVYREKGKV